MKTINEFLDEDIFFPTSMKDNITYSIINKLKTKPYNSTKIDKVIDLYFKELKSIITKNVHNIERKK